MTTAACPIKPLRNYVVIEPQERQLSEHLWTANYEKFNLGTVVAVGEGKRSKGGHRNSPSVIVGDRVRYGNGSYLDWNLVCIGDRKYQVIMEEDICGVIEDATKKR